jgi:hypothetical protein
VIFALHRTESALFIPEKAKSLSSPKTLPHVIPIAFFKVGFTGRIMRKNRRPSLIPSEIRQTPLPGFPSAGSNRTLTGH